MEDKTYNLELTIEELVTLRLLIEKEQKRTDSLPVMVELAKLLDKIYKFPIHIEMKNER